MAENSFIVQRQFANAQGASFIPVTPAMPQPYKPQSFDIGKLLEFMKTGADKFYDYSFKQGQLNQLAGTYQKGKYGILGGAYDDGAKYAKATNDLAQAKADVQQFINDGLANGQSAESILSRVQQRTAPVAQLAQDFLKTHPEAANTMLNQVQGIQAQTLQNYALGEQQMYHQRVLAGDNALAQQSIDTMLTTSPKIVVNGSQYFDANFVATKNKQLFQTIRANRIRAGSSNPDAQAQAIISTGWQAQLVNANMNTDQQRAIVNAIPHITANLVDSGSMSLQQAYRLNAFARGKINEAQQLFKANIEDTLAFAKYSQQNTNFLQREYAKWLTNGGDPMQVHRWRTQWVRRGNQAGQAKIATSGAGATNVSSAAVKAQFHQIYEGEGGKDITATSLIALKRWDQNTKLSKLGGQNLYHNLQMQLPVQGSVSTNTVDGQMPPVLMQLCKIMANRQGRDVNLYSRNGLRDAFGNTDYFQFLELFGDKLLNNAQNGIYSHAQAVRMFQEFHKGNEQRRQNGTDAFKIDQTLFQGWKVPFTKNSSIFGPLNPTVSASLASEFNRDGNIINAVNWSAKSAVVFDPNDPKAGLQAGGYFNETQNGFIIAGNTPLSYWSSDFPDTEAFYRAIENQAMYVRDKDSGFNRKVDTDTCYVWYDTQNNTMRIMRQDGAQHITPQNINMTQLYADYHRFRNEKAKKLATAQSSQIIADVPIRYLPAQHQAVKTYKLQGPIKRIVVDGQEQLTAVQQQRLKQMQAKYGGTVAQAKAWWDNMVQNFYQNDWYGKMVHDVQSGNTATIDQNPQYKQAYDSAMQKYQEFQDWAKENNQTGFDISKTMLQRKGYKLSPTMARLTGVQRLSFQERQKFIEYCKQRKYGTIGVDGTVYPEQTDADVIQNVNDFINADPYNPYKALNATVFYKYWDDYKKQRNAKAQLFMNDDVITQVRASDGRGKYNTFQITKACTLGAYGSLGPKTLAHLAQVQGFILEPRLTNPKASNKPVVGLGYVAGYAAWNKRFQQAWGDPVKLSQVTNEFFTWYTSNVPDKFQRSTGLNFKELRTQPAFETTAIAIADYAWHAGRGANGYYDCLKMVRSGNLMGAIKKLQGTEAYKESQTSRKRYLVAGLMQFDAMLKEM